MQRGPQTARYDALTDSVKWYRLIALTALIPFTSGALAAPAATVEAVRPPAWFGYADTWSPATAGLHLNARNRIRTGPGGRVLLRLAEGSELRIGADTSFMIVAFDPPAMADSPFRGALELARGALRFTTTQLSQHHRRELDIRVARVNAGISGTDVWAKATPENDMVCLLEGRISVAHGDDEPTTMDRPLTFFVVPKGEPAKPIAEVKPEQVDNWIKQVALESGSGIITGGPWSVALASFRREDRAKEALAPLRDAGLPAEILTSDVDGTPWHRLVVSGFASSADATSFVQTASDVAAIEGAWVFRP